MILSLPIDILPLLTKNIELRRRNSLYLTNKHLYHIHTTHTPTLPALSLSFHSEVTPSYTFPVSTLTLSPKDTKRSQARPTSSYDHLSTHLYLQHRLPGPPNALLVQLAFRCGQATLSWSDHPSWCGTTVLMGVVVSNAYGGRLAIDRGKALVRIPARSSNYYCWDGETEVHLHNGGTKKAKNVRPGDMLLGASGGPTVVMRVKETAICGEYKMVDMGDFYITRGHPVYYNKEWYRPDELFPVITALVETLYNFYAEPEHFLVVGRERVVCSSLGGYCPRLAELDVFSDVLYGRGYGSYEAEQYKWLLGLKERIPDEEVYPKVPEMYEDLYPGREDIVILGRTPKL